MTLPIRPLSYPMNALVPIISENTMEFHYGRHYVTYVKNTNELIQNTPMEHLPLKQIILMASSDTIYTGIFNNAAQVFNHEFFWDSLTNDPNKKKVPDELMTLIVSDFGSYESFKEQFKSAALKQFASGWAWLVVQDGHLKIKTTSNAQTPLTDPSQRPLLTIDVWEHAYYLDYQNVRASFVQGVLDHLLNWDMALKRYKED